MIDLKSLRDDWAATHRGKGFFFLIFGLSLLSMILFSLSRIRMGYMDLPRYFSIYSQILYLAVPLSQHRGWAWLQSRQYEYIYSSLPLAEHTLCFQLFLSGWRDLLWLLVPALGAIIAAPFPLWDPGRLILSYSALFLQALLLLAINRLANQWAKGSVSALLLCLIMEIPFFFLLPLSPWSLDFWFSGYFQGSSFIFFIMLSSFLIWAESRFLIKKRYKGGSR